MCRRQYSYGDPDLARNHFGPNGVLNQVTHRALNRALHQVLQQALEL